MKCELCGKLDIGVLYNLSYMNVLKCKNCGLVFTNQSSLKENFKDMYSEHYFKEVHPSYFKSASKEYNKKDLKTNRFRKVLFQLNNLKGKGKVLDIGSGPGVFLGFAKNKGWDVEGIDISSFAAKHAMNTFKVKIRVGQVKDVKFKDKFDAVTMWDFIEHSQTINKDLQKTHEILKDDGILFILTINEDSLMNKIADLVYKISGGKLKHLASRLHPKHHNFHFSRRTLIKMLEKNGFKVISIKGSEVPIEDVETNAFGKISLKIIYFFSKLMNGQYETMLFARKA